MKKQQGLTLLELMIAMALGLIIIAATLGLYINTIRSSTDTIRATRLNHDLEMAINMMGNDIKRAGFWGNAQINEDTRLNPFTVAATDVHIFNLAAPTTIITNAPGNCILYTYDVDADNRVDAETTGTGDTDSDGTIDNEYAGFRLNNNTIEIRVSGTTTADCSNGTWREFINGNDGQNDDGATVNVSELQFSFLPLAPLTATSRCLNLTTNTATDALVCNPAPAAGDNIAVKRAVNIRLTGELVSDNVVRKTLTSSVQLRNNRLYIQP